MGMRHQQGIHLCPAKQNNMEKTKENSKVKVHPVTLDLLVDATWEYAHDLLWHGFPFSKGETELAKKYIREYYEGTPAESLEQRPAAYFPIYCDRVRMAKNYVCRYPHRFIPHPCIWLNKRYSKGFAGTRKWYERAAKRAYRYRQQALIPYSGEGRINPLNVEFHYFKQA